MNNKTKAWIILALSGICLIGGLWLLLQAHPLQTEQEPDITPTPILTPTPVMTATAPPTPTATPNMTAAETPTKKITTGWYHGGGSSRRSSTPPSPIPELATCVLVGIGLLYLMMRR